METYAVRSLPAGTLAPSLSAGNVQQPGVLRDVLAAALEPVARRSRDLIAVLPDAAVRVVLLDFDSLPEKPGEAEAVVRFRLKKALPFDVERAALSYHATPDNGGVRVVAAVALAAVVEEYESAFRDVGFSPGVVLPSTLAALGLVEESDSTMVVKVSDSTAAVTIVRQGTLLLFRVIELEPAGRSDAERLAEEIYPSVVFFMDTFGDQLSRILVGGIDPEAVRPALETQTGVRVSPLLDAARAGSSLGGSPAPDWMLAGVAGALLD